MNRLSKTIAFIALSFSFINANSFASQLDLMPAPLLQLDDLFSHHVLVAEKSTHQLHLFANVAGEPKLVKTVQMATGKKAGDKLFQGDHRTPEGVYQLTEFLTHDDLLKKHGKQGEIYGVGAFVMNYPNPIDSYEGKTGGGIWIHSTNDETRIDKGLDSRGCVVTANKDLIEIAKYIELNRTSIVVVHNLNFMKKDTWVNEKEQIQTLVSDWRSAWANEETDRYLSFYDKKLFKDPNRGGYQDYATYKRAVFSAPGKPEVELTNQSIMLANDYAVVSFVQNYQAPNLSDVGKKLLYLKRNDYYEWKIVSEIWTKNGLEEIDQLNSSGTVAFQPSMRFFTTQNPDQIMEIIPASSNTSSVQAANN